jgi:hypothetical protein
MTSAEPLVRALRWGLIEAEATRDFRARSFPQGASCGCGVTSPLLLEIRSSPLCCYQCGRRRRGLPERERHHIGGHGSPLIALIAANRHRLHDAAYQDILERLPLGHHERIWIELQLFIAFERMLDQAGMP